MGIQTILKDEVGDVLFALNLGNLDRADEYHLALATVAMALGQKKVVEKMILPASVRATVARYDK